MTRPIPKRRSLSSRPTGRTEPTGDEDRTDAPLVALSRRLVPTDVPLVVLNRRLVPTMEPGTQPPAVTMMQRSLSQLVAKVDDRSVTGLPDDAVAQMRQLTGRTGPLSRTEQRTLAQLYATFGQHGIPVTDQITTSPPPVTQPGIELDGVKQPDLTVPQITTIKKAMPNGNAQTSAPEIMRRLIVSGSFAGTTADLRYAIEKTYLVYDAMSKDETPSDEEPYRTIGQQMFDEKDSTATLYRTLRDAGVGVLTRGGLPADQAAAVNRFLAENPRFLAKLKIYVPRGFKFNDGQETKGTGNAMDLGGGRFLDNRISMALLDTATPENFLRLVVHETGHASFQRVLLGKQKLSTELDKHQVLDLLSQVEAMANAQTTRNRRFAIHPAASPDLPIGQISTKVNAVENAKQELNSLPSDAQTFYQAWVTLRANEGFYLLGKDLGPGRRPVDRQQYQAATFSEFCAETFMHAAMGDLDKHVGTLVSNPAVPAEVIQAWLSVKDVVQRYALPILSDPPPADRSGSGEEPT